MAKACEQLVRDFHRSDRFGDGARMLRFDAPSAELGAAVSKTIEKASSVAYLRAARLMMMGLTGGAATYDYRKLSI